MTSISTFDEKLAKVAVVNGKLLASLLREIGMPDDTPDADAVMYLNILTLCICNAEILGIFRLFHHQKWGWEREWSGSIHDEFLKDFVAFFNVFGWPFTKTAQGHEALPSNVVKFSPSERSS